MKANETRMLPSANAIISMPTLVWDRLDELVQRKYPGGYKSLMRAFKKTDCLDTISKNLRSKAQEYGESQMAELYGLANDNKPAKGYGDIKPLPSLPSAPDFGISLPTVYRLFHFMPHATYLTSVWQRRNYHLKSEAPETP